MEATAGASPPDEGAGRRPGGRRRPGIWMWALLAALVLPVAIHVLVAEPMRVPSGSMRPTLLPGQHVLVDKLSYRVRDPQRWELVVFELPDGGLGLKRVVGLPGDRVALRDGVLFVNGTRRQEDYVDYESVDGVFFGPEVVPAGQVFVLGDLRTNSEDSRYLGPVPLDNVVGRAVFIIWPPGHMGRP